MPLISARPGSNSATSDATAHASQEQGLNSESNFVFGFSWLLVMAIGLTPLAEATLGRSPSLTMPLVGGFFIAVSSGILLRRRYTWVGVVLHIYGQIAIWLSLFVMSLAIVLAAFNH